MDSDSQSADNSEDLYKETELTNLKTVTSSEKPTSQNESKSHTDEIYDDIFASVLHKASTGNLPKIPYPKPEISPSQEEIFQNQMGHINSFTKVKLENEFTPSGSPQENMRREAEVNLLKAPEKKLKKKNKTSFQSVTKEVRKSLSGELPVKTAKNHQKSSIKNKKKKSNTNRDVYDFAKDEVQSEKDNKKRKKRKILEEVEVDRTLTQGVWVQCSLKKCLKWRFLPTILDPSSLSEHWTCDMNDDINFNRCSYPEVDWSDETIKEDYVYTKYNLGSIVWAKMASYPSWPAMVDDDPSCDSFYDYTENGEVTHYHVVFLDKHVSRNWVLAKNVETFQNNEDKMSGLLKKRISFSEDLKMAIEEAHDAMKMPIDERIQKYNFATRFSMRDEVKGGKVWTKHEKKARKSKNKVKEEKLHKKIKQSSDGNSSVDDSQVVPNKSSDLPSSQDSEYDVGKESQDDEEEEEKVADDKKLKKKIKKEPSDTPAKPRKIAKSNTTSLNHVKKTNQTSFTKPRKIDKSNKPAIVPSFEKNPEKIKSVKKSLKSDLCSEVSKSKKPKTGFEDSTKKQQTSSSNILKKKKKFQTSFVTPMSQPLPSLHTDSKPENPQIEKSPEPKVISRRGVNLNPESIPQVEICVAEEEVEEVKTVSYNDVYSSDEELNLNSCNINQNLDENLSVNEGDLPDISDL